MKHALVVDDNRALAENLGEILSAEGYVVHVFDDPLRALADTEAIPVELALLDVRMPRLDGVALHRRLLALHPDAAFVLMTAYSEESLLAEALAAGVHCVLPKPVSIPALIEAIERRESSARELLLVDDDPHFAEALTEVLHDSGYRVRRAATARDARASASVEMLAAIIDIRLPDEDGVALGAELARAVPIRVVLISGFTVEDVQLHGERVRVLEKPFSPEALLSQLSAMRKDRA